MNNNIRTITNSIISVIIPVYKVEPYLDRCVQSVVDQTYDNIEIILVDDGSPDNCPAMCDAWVEKNSRIKVIHKENGGLSDARNAGLKIAAGDLVGFVDSDDWIAPEMYERLKKALDDDQSDIAACTVEMVWEDGSPNNLLTVQENCILERIEAQRALMNESKLKQPVWYKLYKKSVIAGIPFEKGKQHEDVYWSYQVVGNASRVSVVDYVGYFYWQRKNSIMGSQYSPKHLDAIEAYCRRYEYLKNNCPELEKQARISILGNCIYHGQMALHYLSSEEQINAFDILERTKNRYPVHRKETAGMKASHRFWLMLGSRSLRLVCRIKNALKVGI